MPFAVPLFTIASLLTGPTADCCRVFISLLASVAKLKAFADAWLRIFSASSLLVAARSLAASIPCVGGESHTLGVAVHSLLLLAVGVVDE